MRQRLFFAGVLLAMLVVVCEGGAYITWWLLTGEGFGYWRAERRRAEAIDTKTAVEESIPANRRWQESGLQLHPFLGYVYPPGPLKEFIPHNVHGPVNAYGFIDDRPSLRKRAPDRYIVGITGGSYAAQCSNIAYDVLAEELQKSPRLKGRRVEFVRTGLGGFKQPQQLIAIAYLSMLGGEFDCVVNIDGFNEVALTEANTAFDVPEFFPRDWASMIEAKPTPEFLLRVGRLAMLRQQRAEAALRAGGLWWSMLAQVAWLVSDRRQALAVHEALQAVTGYREGVWSQASRGPGRAPTLRAATERMASLWMHCSRMLDAVCRANGATYFHFLQPNQYDHGSKPISEAEAKVAILPQLEMRTGVEMGYPLLGEQIPALLAAGVRFTDLRQLYRDHPEPLYIDPCCHVNEAGYQIAARRVAAVIRRHLDLEGAEIRSLAIEPDALVIDDPRVWVPFQVVAVVGDGTRHDVGDPGFGTILGIDDPELLALDPTGRLQARRRGTTTLRARLQGKEAELRVTAAWPDILVGDGPRGGAPAPGPHLAVVAGPGADGCLQMQCAGIPADALGLLAVAARPLPVQAPTDLSGITLSPIAAPAGGGAATLRVPALAVPDMPQFLRAYFIGRDATVAATSNSVVFTRSR